jgi:hypothetical protein
MACASRQRYGFGRNNCRGVLYQNRLTVRANASRAFGPEGTNTVEPLFNHGSESAGPRVIGRANLIGEPEVPEKRYRLRAFGGEASIRQPHEEVQHGRRRGQYLDCFEVIWNRMGDEFLVELVAEHDDVFKLRRQGSLIRMIPAVPDLRFPHEIEAASLDHRCPTRKPVRAEEDRRTEDPFERADQPAVLLSTGVHSETLQHISAAVLNRTV